MAQRRNSSGRDERSDLTDMKALAAKARSDTGGPVLKPNAAELSGVRPRRDSVIGMRLTPPPRATSSELPNWFWGVLGCLSVLLVGFAALFVLGRSGKLGPLLGQAASLVATAPAAAPPPPPPPVAPVAVAEPAAKEAEPAPRAERSPAERAAAAEHAAERAAAAEHAASAERAAAPDPTPPPPQAGEGPAAAEPAPAAADEGGGTKRAARATTTSAKAPAAKASEPAVADQDDNGGGAAADPKAPPSRPARAAAPAAKPAAGEDSSGASSDDDQSAPGQDDVEKALDALATRVRGCFVKYQIKGTARVRLVATPAGKAESVNVTGDFEDTPTGLCVESILNEAKLPTFKGPPLKLSQSYQLR